MNNRIPRLSGFDDQAKKLIGIRLDGRDLNNWSFSGQDLTNAVLYEANLENVDLTDAVLTFANLQSSRRLTSEQMYSTRSYQEKNLEGINLKTKRGQGQFSTHCVNQSGKLETSAFLSSDTGIAGLNGNKIYRSTYAFGLTSFEKSIEQLNSW